MCLYELHQNTSMHTVSSKCMINDIAIVSEKSQRETENKLHGLKMSFHRPAERGADYTVTEDDLVSNLVFYAQSTIAVISERESK